MEVDPEPRGPRLFLFVVFNCRLTKNQFFETTASNCCFACPEGPASFPDSIFHDTSRGMTAEGRDL